jgi:hypothetical protein
MFSTGKQICLYTYANPDLLHFAAKHSQGSESDNDDYTTNNGSSDYTDLDISDLFVSN